jgi:hypothetical protein
METNSSLLIDALLTAGFGVQHSILATLSVKARTKKWFGWEPIAWRSVESLVNVSYILLAVAAWQPVDVVIWDASGIIGYTLLIITVASWIWYWQLHLFEYDCGLAFGSTSLVARISDRPIPNLVPWKVGSRRWIRFPVHTAFFGMFLCLPRMTADLLVLGIVLNIYNVIGSVLYDLRILKLSGEPYRKYMEVTGLIWPPIYRAPQGARDLTMPAPLHWAHPAMHVSGVFFGLLLGTLYFLTLGSPETTLVESAKVATVGLLGSLLVGFAIGRSSKPRAPNWEQQQTDLSTTVAISAAIGVMWWASLTWLKIGEPPNFAYYLPLWFIVQYLGHVFAVAADIRKWVPSAAPPKTTFQPEDVPRAL